MPAIPEASIRQTFTDARTFANWLPDPVSDQTLRDLYDLVKLGPTSANSCPARIVFIRPGPAREKLLACLAPLNVPKVQAAPVTAIIAFDETFYDLLPILAPHADYRSMFASNKAVAEETAFRNSSLQGGYFIIAARALGLDCGPMSGFNKAKADELFFKDTTWKSNFLCNLGHGDRTKLHPRSPRLSFDEACKIM
jgi:nitroreductase